MGNLKQLSLGLAVALSSVVAVSTAKAQTVSTHCGLNTQTVTATIFYDPFNPSPVSSTSVNVPLSRFVGSSGGKKTQQVDFYFTQPTGSPAFTVLYGGVNVLYTQATPGTGGGAPTLNNTSPPSGTIGVNFLGTAQPDTINVPITIGIPAGLDLSNGLSVTFGIVYVCNGTGGLDDETTPQYLASAVTMPVKVLSALQASFAGPALDFGNVQTAGSGTFTNFKAPVSGPGFINVKSSGPYTVAMVSANNYILKWGASNAAADTIKYSLHFLGQNLSNGAPTFTTANCTRAGVLAAEQLQMRATLAEQADTKTVAAYQDTLTVTITPTNFIGATSTCSTL